MTFNILAIALAFMAFAIITMWLVLTFVITPLVKENKKHCKICNAASIVLSLCALIVSLCAFFLPNDKDTVEDNAKEYESAEQIELYIPEEALYGEGR